LIAFLRDGRRASGAGRRCERKGDCGRACQEGRPGKSAGLDIAAMHVMMISDLEINAFATQPEDIFINAGILLWLKKPNELIGVMAHETGHIAAGHISRTGVGMEHAMIPMLLSMVLGAAAMAMGAGDAGMVATNSPDVAERARMLRQHGMRRRYNHDEIGWNTRMDGFQGAILSVKLKYIEGWNRARRALAKRYHALFRATGLAESGPYPLHGVILPHEAAGSKHVWNQYVIRTARRDQLREFLTSRQIGSEIYYPVPLHLQDALKSLGYKEGSFPEAERAAREVLALPIFPELREDEQQTVVAAIAEFLS